MRSTTSPNTTRTVAFIIGDPCAGQGRTARELFVLTVMLVAV